MNRWLRVVTLIVPLIVIAAEASAQEPAAQTSTAVPVQVQVVVSRYQGEKKLSSVPYAVSAKPGEARGANLRLMTSVPVYHPSLITVPGDAKEKPSPLTYNFRDIGISMDVFVRPGPAEGRYEVLVTISESSLAPESRPSAAGAGVVATLVRSYESRNVMVLQNGQTSQYTAATDPVSGEVVRVDVTLTIPK